METGSGPLLCVFTLLCFSASCGKAGAQETPVQLRDAAAKARDEARAWELRDAKGPTEPLLYDNGFLRALAVHYIWQAAKKSEPAAKLKRAVDASRDFDARLLEHL